MGIATIGHAPLAAMVNPEAGSVCCRRSIDQYHLNSFDRRIDERITERQSDATCNNPGEDARLYKAVEACSDFCCSLGINIPTGKDSLSMTQKYGNEKVFSPGTVIISAGAGVSDVKKTVGQVLVNDPKSAVYYVDFSFDTHKLGGSVLGQTLNKLGEEVPTMTRCGILQSRFR